MARQVEIASGYKAVALPDGNIYSEGNQVVLTNAEWDRVNPSAIGTVVLDLGGLVDPDLDEGLSTDEELATHTNDTEAHSGSPLVTSVAAAHTVPDGSRGRVILADASGGAFAVTLPTAVPGPVVRVKKLDATANAVTVATPGAETIDGAADAALSAQNEDVGLISDGTNWFIIG